MADSENALRAKKFHFQTSQRTKLSTLAISMVNYKTSKFLMQNSSFPWNQPTGKCWKRDLGILLPGYCINFRADKINQIDCPVQPHTAHFPVHNQISGTKSKFHRVLQQYFKQTKLSYSKGNFFPISAKWNLSCARVRAILSILFKIQCIFLFIKIPLSSFSHENLLFSIFLSK